MTPDNETRIARVTGRKYRYRVVSSNGAGIYGPDHRTFARAKSAALQEAERSRIAGQVFEVERLIELPGGGHRYWMMRRGRWAPWSATEDIEQRRPVFSATSAGAPPKHTKSGNCTEAHSCRHCDVENLCDVCHLHDEPRGECSACPQCEACETESPK